MNSVPNPSSCYHIDHYVLPPVDTRIPKSHPSSIQYIAIDMKMMTDKVENKEKSRHDLRFIVQMSRSPCWEVYKEQAVERDSLRLPVKENKNKPVYMLDARYEKKK